MATLHLKTNQWIKSCGRLVYDPRRTSNTKSRWWCVVEPRDNIDGYFRWMLDRNWWMTNHDGVKFVDDDNVKIKSLIPPNWGGHISVVRGAEPKMNKDLWGFNNGKMVEFYYKNSPYKIVQEDERMEYWAIEVKCKELSELRRMFGLIDYGDESYHLTIGRREL